MQHPKHIALIADGNRTRAKNQWMSSMDGHFAGAQNTIDILQYIFSHTNIDVVTWWFLSTENVKQRSQEELLFITSIYKKIGNDLDDFMQEHHINFRWFGNRDGLPEDFVQFLDQKRANFTFTDSPKTAVFTFNYWWRDEIIRWIKTLQWEDLAELTEEKFSHKLDFWSLPPLDMIIRTKWEKAHRTSWFMARWSWYAELYFAKDYYPDFKWPQLEEAIARYSSIVSERNFWK